MSVITRTRPGRALLVAVATLMIAALVFLGPSGNATTTVTGDIGIVLLSTGPDDGDNWVRYYEGDYGDPDGTDLGAEDWVEDNWKDHQEITLDRCLVATTNTILEITQTGGNRGLGLVSNGFGTRDKDNCATSNGQIKGADTLTLALGSMFDDLPVAIDLVEIDVEGKQNADLEYRLDLENPYEAYDLTNPASDNGPDSGPSDNEIAVIASTEGFRSISFRADGPRKALISIEGGGDGPVVAGTESDRLDVNRERLGVNQSLFRVVTTRTWDGELDCGDPATAGNSSEDGPAESGYLVRGDDTKPDDPCVKIPYTFQIEDTNVFFDFEDNGEGNRFLVRIDWNPGDYSPVEPPIRQVDYYNDGVDDYVDGVACTGSDDVLAEGPSIDFDYSHPFSTPESPIPDGAGSSFSDGTSDPVEVPVCLAGEQMVLTSAGWQQIQWWDVTGDPRWN